MAYQRKVIAVGERITLGDVIFQIKGIEGLGGSSIVYQADYEDALNEGVCHHVLLKELFPLTPRGEIYRNEEGAICCTLEGEEILMYHKVRFRQGNQVNLKLLDQIPSRMSGNVNSYEAYGTYYSVLSVHGGKNLQYVMEEGEIKGLHFAAEVMEHVLDALECFHKNGYLHLDISPDNILLLSNHAMLIDYNSVWSMEESQEDAVRHSQEKNKNASSKRSAWGRQGMSGNDGFVFQEKEGYSAPEIHMRDRDNIGVPTDIYSVCAVFFRMLAGRPLGEEEIIGQGLRRWFSEGFPFLEGEPDSAVYKVYQILAKGLHTLPRKRYQSIEELRKDLEELICRMEHRGISHAALWESSRIQFRKQKMAEMRFLPRKIVLSGKNSGDSQETPDIVLETTGQEEGIYQILCNIHNSEKTHGILLYGAGGMGKTTFLRELWKQNMRRYLSNMPVVCYLSLRERQISGNYAEYIQNSLVRGMAGAKERADYREAFQELEQFLDDPPSGKMQMILILDGLNESGNRRELLLGEIEQLARKPGVAILVTDRTDKVKRYALSAFWTAKLLPLERNIVEAELLVAGCPLPEKEDVASLLTNPMMLELYKDIFTRHQALPVEEKDMDLIRTADGLVRVFLDHLCCKQIRIDSGNQAMQLNHKYILMHLLPAVAGEMKRQNHTVLTLEELYAVASDNFQNLRKQDFGKCFPEYLGKSRMMLSGVQNESEWFDFAVSEQLVGTMGLLVVSENNEYRLSHDNFLNCLEEMDKQNKSIYEKGKKKVRRKKWEKKWMVRGGMIVVAILTAAGTAAATRYFGGNKGEEETVYSEEEQKIVDSVETYLLTNLGILDSQITIQRDILDMAEADGVLENNQQDVTDLQEWIEKKLKQTDSYTILELKEGLAEELVAINPDYPVGQLQELCQAPADMDLVMEQALTRLLKMLCDEDSVYADVEDRQKIVKVYTEYLDAYTKYIFYEFDYVALYTFPDSLGELMNDYRYMDIFDDYFTSVNMTGQNLAVVEATMENAYEDLKTAQRNMQASNYQVDWE